MGINAEVIAAAYKRLETGEVFKELPAPDGFIYEILPRIDTDQGCFLQEGYKKIEE